MRTKEGIWWPFYSPNHHQFNNFILTEGIYPATLHKGIGKKLNSYIELKQNDLKMQKS